MSGVKATMKQSARKVVTDLIRPVVDPPSRPSVSGESLRYWELEQVRNRERVAALTLRGTGGRTTSYDAPKKVALHTR